MCKSSGPYGQSIMILNAVIMDMPPRVRSPQRQRGGPATYDIWPSPTAIGVPATFEPDLSASRRHV